MLAVHVHVSFCTSLLVYTFKKVDILTSSSLKFEGRDIVVSIATCYVLDGPGIESRWG
jgi:hypothetical protein